VRLVTNIHRSVVNRTFLLSMALCLFVAGCIDSTHQSNNSTDVPVTTAELPELLPLQTLLAPAGYVAPQISPNGRWISYIAPLDGVANFFVAPSDQPKSGQAVTSFTDRGVQATDISGVVMYSWHADSEHIIYPVDYDGDENWDIHIVNIVSGEERNLTPSPGIKTQIIASDRNSPNEVVILVNERHPMLPDVYRLNLQTGLRENILMNPGKVLGFLADDNLKLRLAVAINAEGGIDISRISDDKEFDTFMQISAEDLPALTTSSSQKIIRLNQSNEHLYLYDVEGRDTTAFISLNLSSGEKKVIAQDKRADLAGILYEPLTNKPLA